MTNMITLSIAIAIFIAIYLPIKRKIKNRMDGLADMIAGTYANLDYLKECADNSAKSLEYITSRQELSIVINKYNLTITRLQLMEIQRRAIENEDYEGAKSLGKTISYVEQLLEQQ